MLNQERNVTILITSHNMRDIEEICHQILVLQSGRLLYDGPIKGLAGYTDDSVSIIVATDHSQPPERIGHIQGSNEGGKVTYKVSKDDLPMALSQLLRVCRPDDIHLQEDTLEDIILQLQSEVNTDAV